MVRRVATLYRAAFAGLPRDVWLLCGIALVNRAGTMVLPFISLFLTQDRGYSVTTAGRLLALFGLGSVVGSLLGGWLSDRIGSVRTQQLSLAATGVGFLWLLRLDGLAEMGAALFLVSVVSEAFRPAVMAATGELAPETVQARAYALLRLAANLGMGVGPALGGFLALKGYGWLFLADAATCWLAAALLLVFLPPRPTVHGHEESPRRSSRSPWRDGPFLLLLGLVFLLATCFFQILSTMPLFFRQVHGLRENVIGMLLATNALIIVIFEMVLTHWAERRPRMPLVGLGCFLVCAGFGLMPLGSSVAFLMMTIVVWTTGEMLVLPLTNAAVAGRAGARHRGRYMGLYTVAFSAAFIVAPLAGTWIFERLGPDVLWYGIGILGAPLWLWALALSGPFRADPASPAPRHAVPPMPDPRWEAEGSRADLKASPQRDLEPPMPDC